MGQEIERKFLVTGAGWRTDAARDYLCQGYLCRDPERVVRVRLAGEIATLTIKGLSHGPVRAEYEYRIPVADAAELLAMCEEPAIEKTRHRVSHQGMVWEVDEFHGRNEGLLLAECELADAAQDLQLPDWVGREVTDDVRYSNSNLAARPFCDW